MEEQKVLYKNQKVFMSPRLANRHKIYEIYIDMTGWKDNVCPNDKGTYAYTVIFCDDSNTRQEVVCTGIRSNGMKKLLTEMREKYNLTPSEGTMVHILGPAGSVKNTNIPYGCVSKCCVQALRLHGMDALDFYPTDDNNAGIRLESVLDEVVHQSNIGYHGELYRGATFPRSIYHYDVKESAYRKGKSKELI